MGATVTGKGVSPSEVTPLASASRDAELRAGWPMTVARVRASSFIPTAAERVNTNQTSTPLTRATTGLLSLGRFGTARSNAPNAELQ